MRRFVQLVFFAALLIPAARADESAVAGTVIQIRGASSDNLTKDMPVLVGDFIVTGHNTRIALKMTDGSVLTLGADTEFAINDYRYSQQTQQGSASLELIKGAFRCAGDTDPHRRRDGSARRLVQPCRADLRRPQPGQT